MNVSHEKMKNIFSDNSLELPLRVGENGFCDSLKRIFQVYINSLDGNIDEEEVNEIKSVCDKILCCIEEYHNGYPHRAYSEFERLMNTLNIRDTIRYQKTGTFNIFRGNDPLKLFRVRHTKNNNIELRKDLFHTPFNLRSHIGTCRYSIPGYPCLYLGTSLKLCLDEVKRGRGKPITYASKFEINRDYMRNGNIDIVVLEFGVKPSDFFSDIPPRDNNHVSLTRREHLDEIRLDSSYNRGAYVKWYPLYAACSFIRKEKRSPFASEYIIPQLLMQWLRAKANPQQIVGLRYFPCSSKAASERGMNYVFPVSDEVDNQYNQFCNLLKNTMKLTKPIVVGRSNVNQFHTMLVFDTECSYI